MLPGAEFRGDAQFVRRATLRRFRHPSGESLAAACRYEPGASRLVVFLFRLVLRLAFFLATVGQNPAQTVPEMDLAQNSAVTFETTEALEAWLRDHSIATSTWGWGVKVAERKRTLNRLLGELKLGQSELHYVPTVGPLRMLRIVRVKVFNADGTKVLIEKCKIRDGVTTPKNALLTKRQGKDEDPISCALRALRKELGSFFLDLEADAARDDRESSMRGSFLGLSLRLPTTPNVLTSPRVLPARRNGSGKDGAPRSPKATRGRSEITGRSMREPSTTGSNEDSAASSDPLWRFVDLLSCDDVPVTEMQHSMHYPGLLTQYVITGVSLRIKDLPDVGEMSTIELADTDAPNKDRNKPVQVPSHVDEEVQTMATVPRKASLLLGEMDVHRASQQLQRTHPDMPGVVRHVWRFVTESEVTASLLAILQENRSPPACVVDPSEIELYESIGSGAYGEVFRAMWRSTEVCVKRLNHTRSTARLHQELRKEAEILASLRHPNIVLFLGVCVTSNFLAIVLEYCQRGSLYSVVHSGEEMLPQLAARMACDVARGMGFLHSCEPQIVHRDLKSVNCLIGTDWRACVADFGISRLVRLSDQQSGGGKGVEKHRPVGTLLWAAPEVLRSEQATAASDVYSFGITMFEVCARELPFVDLEPGGVAWLVLTGERPESTCSDTAAARMAALEASLPGWTALMRQCWIPDEAFRPTFPTVIQGLVSIMENAPTHAPRRHSQATILPPIRQQSQSAVSVAASGSSAGGGGLSLLDVRQYPVLDPDDVTLDKVAFTFRGGTVYATQLRGDKVFVRDFASQAVRKAGNAQYFRQQIDLMLGLEHPNLCAIIGVHLSDRRLLLATAAPTRGVLRDLMWDDSKPAPGAADRVKLANSTGLQLAKALAALHYAPVPITHRDLTPLSIYLDGEWDLRLAEFAFSWTNAVTTLVECDAAAWAAPEVLCGKQVTAKADSYSWASIVWSVLYWQFPFAAVDGNKILEQVVVHNARPPLDELCDPRLATLLVRCWQVNTTARPSSVELVQLMEDLCAPVDAPSSPAGPPPTLASTSTSTSAPSAPAGGRSERDMVHVPPAVLPELESQLDKEEALVDELPV